MVDAKILDQIQEEAWLGFDTSMIKIPDELGNIWAYDEPPGLVLARYLRKPENFGFLCSNIFNVKLMPFQLAVLKEMWVHKFPMMIASRGFGKSFLLSLYSMMRALLHPNHKVVIAGAGFRQSKHLFAYTEVIWNRSPVLRSLCRGSDRQGPRRDIDRCTMQICDSTITFLPVGSGGTIRGERAHTLIVDEFSVLPLQIYEVVLRGFTSTSSDPVRSSIEYRTNQILKERYGIEIEKIAGMGNQSIISGTCDYDFQHFATYWKRYKQIIESRGDSKLLGNVDVGLDETAVLDHEDFSVIRIPYNLLPPAFMDAGSIASSRATMNASAFLCEYGACLGPNTNIITDKGAKFVQDINIGDLVLTHNGRFRPVTDTMRRYVKEDIYKLKGYGYSNDILITKEHPLYQSNDSWGLVEDADKLYLSNLKELSNKQDILVSDFTDRYIIKKVDDVEYIYPMWSKSRITNDEYQYIESQEGLLSAKEVANNIGCSRSIVYNIWANKTKIDSKSYIGNIIKLDYNFGLVVGYYLAEGSIGADGKSVAFSLDGHVNTNLQTYINKLSTAIRNIFHIEPKLYIKQDNVTDVSINRRMIADLLSSIVPGIANTKLVIPDILYSNKDFLRGFIEGYWDGDGHWTVDRIFCSCSSTSLSLITQIKTVLSVFGITSSIHIKPSSKAIFRNKEYDSKEAYILCIYGDDARRFKHIFYGVPYEKLEHNRLQNVKTYNNSVESVYNIRAKELIPYDGYVYNFEVAEDNSYSLLGATVHNCFSKDSDGFFKRSLLDACTFDPNAPKDTYPPDAEMFEARTSGNPERKYVYGIDPASESDNFSIVILELHQNHTRIVYCWTTNKKEHKVQLKAKLTTEQNFYAYVVRKVRQLMKTFPPAKIGCDSQGGGVGVREAFYDQAHIEEGELPIFPVPSDDPAKPNDTDLKAGLHIVEYVQFAKADWTTEANNFLRKDFENKTLLFPYFDTASLEMAAIDDQQMEEEGKLKFDSLENIIWEIEELKSELATIVETKTAAQNRSHWDTPEIKLPNNKKGRMRKDRYSALVIANMLAHSIQRTEVKPEYRPIGGFAHSLAGNGQQNEMFYTGPQTWVDAVQDFFS